MCPLEIESYGSAVRHWVRVSKVRPGDSRLHPEILPDFKRNLYKFECTDDDSHSLISIARDLHLREKAKDEDFVLLRRLDPGESMELSIRSGRRSGKRTLKLTHAPQPT